MKIFKPEDFKEAISIGEARFVLDRLAEAANQILSERNNDAGINSTELADKITALRAKVRAIGHFIEFQNPDEALPDDMDTVYWGIGMILNEISEDMKSV